MRKVLVVLVLVIVLAVALGAVQHVRADNYTRDKTTPPRDCYIYDADSGTFVWGPCPVWTRR